MGPESAGFLWNQTGIELEIHVYMQIYIYKHVYMNVGIPILFKCHVSKGHVTC
jgi:hypothetical protein